MLHGKRASPALMGRVLACLAESLGLRGTARVCEIAPHTVRHWLVAAAEQLPAFVAYLRHELRVHQVQLDALDAVLRAVRDANRREAEAVAQLSRSHHWGGSASAPETQGLLSAQGG